MPPPISKLTRPIFVRRQPSFYAIHSPPTIHYIGIFFDYQYKCIFLLLSAFITEFLLCYQRSARAHALIIAYSPRLDIQGRRHALSLALAWGFSPMFRCAPRQIPATNFHGTQNEIGRRHAPELLKRFRMDEYRYRVGFSALGFFQRFREILWRNWRFPPHFLMPCASYPLGRYR